MEGHAVRLTRVAAAALMVAAVLVLVPTVSLAAPPGTPFGWGANPFGQLGDGTLTSHAAPAPVLGLTDAIDLHGGRGHVIALRANGTVVTWGDNNYGQLGNNSTVDRTAPGPVAGLTNIVEVTTGHYHCLALRSDGTVWAWGMNASGQLGDGSATHRHTPVQVSGLSTIIHIAAGRDMSYALRSDGTVWAWGRNADGELGDGTTVGKTTAVQVIGLAGITAIAAGRNHGLAIGAGGAVWAWGDNQYGQIGNGTTPDRTTAVQVPGLSNIAMVVAGAHMSYALRSDGTIASWGRNNLGQLGDGTTTIRRSPVSVIGASSVVFIGAGRDHGLAVRSDGTGIAWGRNDFRQLGDGTTTNRTSAVTIAGLSGATEVHGGQDYSVALVTAGPPDTDPPTIPGQPVGQSDTPTTIGLTWAASDDASSSIDYQVVRDGTPVGNVTSASTTTVSFTDTNLTPGSTHTYVVIASDPSGNDSDPSPLSDPITVQTGPAAIFSDDFSSGNLSAWTMVMRMTIDATIGSPTAPSARAQVTGQSAFAKKTLASPVSNPCLSARVNAANLGGNSVILLRTLTSGGVGVIRVLANASGVLVIRSDVSGVQFSSQIALGSGWVTLEVCGTVGTSSAWDLYRNGAKIVDRWMANTGTSAVGQIQIGDTTAKTFTLNVDDVVVDQLPG